MIAALVGAPGPLGISHGGRPRAWLCLLLMSALVGALGLFLACAPLGLCVALVGCGIGAVLVGLRPHRALYLLAFTIPFASSPQFRLPGLALGANECALAALTGAWLLRAMASRRLSLRGRELGLPMLFFLWTLLVSLWPADDLGEALKEVSKWAECVLLLGLTATLGPREDKGHLQRRLVAALLLAGSLEAALGIYQFVNRIGPEGFVLLGRYMRAYGTFAQPNPFGGYLGLLLPLAYSVVLTRWREGWQQLRCGRYGPAGFWVLAAATTVAMLAGLIMSWSRGALLGLAAGGLLVALALARRAWLGISIVGLAVLLITVGGRILPQALWLRLTDTFQYVGTTDLSQVEITDENFAVIERTAHWRAAWRMFDRSPWVGVGTGQYATVYPSVALPRWPDPLGHAHNYFLHIMAEGGLLGLAGYLVLLMGAFIVTWRQAWQAKGWQRTIALGALGMLGHLVIHNTFDNLFVHGLYLVVAMLLGMAVAWRAHTGPSRPTNSGGVLGKDLRLDTGRI